MVCEPSAPTTVEVRLRAQGFSASPGLQSHTVLAEAVPVTAAVRARQVRKVKAARMGRALYATAGRGPPRSNGASMLTDFRQFVVRGNLIELAVAVVIGTAFAAVVASFVEDLVTPLIAAIGGESDFSALTFEINGSRFRYGDFINALLAFLLVAAVLFFLVIRPANALLARAQSEQPEDEDSRKCPECLSQIPNEARRCAYCTAQLSAA